MRHMLEEFLRKRDNELQRILLSNIKKKVKKSRYMKYMVITGYIYQHSNIHTAFLNASLLVI